MHIAIIGNGISGITAARTLRKADPDCRITVISAETKYFFSRTALMYIYMGHMKFEHTKPYEDSFWEKNNIDLMQDKVLQVDFLSNALLLESGGQLSYDKLLLATGSKSNKFGWPGQDLRGVQSLYSYQDLELLEKNTHKAGTLKKKQRVHNAVIVGGGLIGVELAEMLISRNIQVTFLIREEHFWGNVLPQEESKLICRHMEQHGVKFLFETELKEVLSDEEGRVRSILTNTGNEVVCQFLGLTVGVSPNVDFLKGSTLDINRGILVNRRLETNVKYVYAAGDCAELREAVSGRQNIEQVWYTGRIMGELAARNMLGEAVEYNPGPWFNSAKFFDIEYQNYGRVHPKLMPASIDFYWENSEGNKCLKMVMDSDNRRLIGLNVFGIRIRHEKMDQWLREEREADFFIKHWCEICFDPEFYRNEAEGIIDKFNDTFKTTIKKQTKTWLERITSVL